MAGAKRTKTTSSQREGVAASLILHRSVRTFFGQIYMIVMWMGLELAQGTEKHVSLARREPVWAVK